MTRISGLGGGAPGMTGLNNSGQIAQSPAPSSAAQGNAAINKPDKNGYTPLLRQLTQQDVSAANVDALLKQGASVSATVFAPDDEQLGENPNHRATINYLQEVSWLFEVGQASPTQMAEAVHLLFRDRNAGGNALTLAIELGLGQDIIHSLTSAGGPELLNSCDGLGDTPLCLAAAKGDLDIVHSLIAAGADLKQQNAREQSLLECAVHEGRDVVVHALLSMGADVHAFKVITQALANLALRWRDLPPGSRTRLFMELEAAKHPPAKSYMHKLFEPAIDQAIAGDTSLLEELLASDGLDISRPIFFPSDGMSPLGRAIRSGSEELCRMLLETKRINLDFVFKDDPVVTPLRFAVRTGNVAICQLVAEYSGPWHRLGILDEAASGVAKDGKSIDATIWCLDRGYESSELATWPVGTRRHLCAELFPFACERAIAGKLELLDSLFENQLLFPDEIAVLWGNPAGNFLSLALRRAEEGNFSLLKAFAEYGLVHSALRIESERTPMTYAVKHHRGLVPALLNFGFAVNLEDELGDTPLALAIAANDLETVRLLADAGALA